ncbi:MULTISPECIES: 2-dehydropantoate 2-reductase [Acidobacteriaceae]|uniref:2-dehydropantoate 2-reductase n=1 Tax=Acidobacteriaceae TaxID=204434 RepID=UPI00131B917F|nr:MULTISPECIES: 2-dehydropantoate 2-reductase [Acidobacteriaceae]MDW5264578.1 2-dehydropantoate 2-reductase [Edaphobacter sp.]
MARIAIIGVGAIGAIIASLLQQAGHELVLCVRRPLAQLTVDTPDGPIAIHATVLTDPTKASTVDWVIVATKAYDVPGAAKWLKQLRAEGAPVAVLQNGVEHRERFAPYVPVNSILPIIVDCPAERQSSERVRQRGVMHLKALESELGRAFVDLFAGTAADAVVVSDFTTVAWRKLCHNAAGVLPTLLLQPSGVLHDEAIGETALQIVRECIAVGRAEGAMLDDDVAEAVLHAYRTAPADGINSLHADRLAGRPMEIDARNGVIVRLGKKHGIATPCNQMAIALLESMVQNF